MAFNHVNDPLYFLEALQEFGFWYDWFYESNIQTDEMGEDKISFVRADIYGSIQPQGTSLNQSKDGNTQTSKYDFYCMANYRIKNGDFIYYQHKWLHVDSVHDYDEWGVRSCTLTMINLNTYKDLAESIKFLEGYETV